MLLQPDTETNSARDILVKHAGVFSTCPEDVDEKEFIASSTTNVLDIL